MRYQVILIPSNEGFEVGCPALPGCWSQGATEEEALENMRDAIEGYVSIWEETLLKEYAGSERRAVEVEI